MLITSSRPPLMRNKMDKKKIGGKIHKILNLTLSRKLTFEEYENLVKLIAWVFSPPTTDPISKKK